MKVKDGVLESWEERAVESSPIAGNALQEVCACARECRGDPLVANAVLKMFFFFVFALSVCK